MKHALAGDHGEVAVRAAVERAGAAEIGAGPFQLHRLADDPDEIRRFPDLLDQLVRDEAHARNSATVTPAPP